MFFLLNTFAVSIMGNSEVYFQTFCSFILYINIYIRAIIFFTLIFQYASISIYFSFQSTFYSICFLFNLLFIPSIFYFSYRHSNKQPFKLYHYKSLDLHQKIIVCLSTFLQRFFLELLPVSLIFCNFM